MNILGCVSNVALLSCLLIFADARVSAAQSMRARIEADWLRQAEAWWPRPAPTQADAAGAVDGVKDGKYAFHTGQDANPWWQVDLGEAQPITRIVVFNRLDYAPGLHNADNLLILVSDDAKQWRQIYDNQGKHFDGVLGVPAFADEAADKSKRVETSPDLPPKGGTTNPPPLEVKFKDGEVRTRYVRLQIPSDKPIFFHLDEVEIYGPADPAKNLALRQPADQSSVSQWSTSKISGPKLAAAVTPEVIRHFVERGRLLAAELKQVGVETMAFEREFDDVAMRLASISEIRNPRSEIRSASGDSAIRNSAGAGTAIGHAGLSTSSPSPRPSPAGRGSRGSQPGEQTGSLGSVQSLTAGLPLPAGEGRGEGEQADPLARQLDLNSDVVFLRDLYFQVRWAMRRLAFRNPLLDFDRLLIVKRFGQETYPDVCLNHMPWVSRPGGDLCLLTLRGPEEAPLVKNLLNGRLGPGHVHGADLRWDARRIVFGYAKAQSDQPPEGWLDRAQSFRLRRTEEPIHIFEISVSGRGLRQLTRGEWSDLDPTYAPNGDIVFVSERCGTSLQCNEYDKDETSCNLYSMRPDGSGIRRLSVSKDGDYLPHTLDDGSIGYTRWEYHERSWAFIQSLWTVRPDGTQADAIFKQHFVNPWSLEDVRSIPGTRNTRLVCIAAGHHTLAAGPVVVVTPGVGINEPRGIRIVTPGVVPPEGGMDGVPVAEGGVRDQGGYYMTPWALSEKTFLASYSFGTGKTGLSSEIDPTGYAIYLIDVFGTKELISRDATISCFTPIPVRPRPRPPVLPDLTLYASGHMKRDARDSLSPPRGERARVRGAGIGSRSTSSKSRTSLPLTPALSPATGGEGGERKTSYATCLVSTVSYGCEGIPPERIRFIRISEPIGWPYDNAHGGQRYGEDHRYSGAGAERKNLTSWTPLRILGDVPVERDGSAKFRVPADTAVYFQILDENRMELRRMRSFISFQPGEHRSCMGCHESRGVTPVPAENAASLAMTRDAATPLPAPWGDRPVSFLRDIQPVLDRHCVSCHSGLKPAGGIDLFTGLTSHDAEVAGYGHNRAYETILEKELVSVSAVRKQDASITPPLAYGSHKSKLITCLTDAAHRDQVALSGEDRLRLVVWIDANAPYHDRFVNKRTAQTAYDLASDKELLKNLTTVHERRCAACHKTDEVTRLDWIDFRAPARSLFLTARLSKETGGSAKCSEPVYANRSDADYSTARELVDVAVAKAWQNPRRDLAALERPAQSAQAGAPASVRAAQSGEIRLSTGSE